MRAEILQHSRLRGHPSELPPHRSGFAPSRAWLQTAYRYCGWLSCLLLLLGTFAASAGAARAEGFAVIVHRSNPVDSLRANYVSQLFLDKISRWENGEKVKPVDQSPRSATRAAFSLNIHGRPVRAIQSYWQQQIFTGRGLPPAELDSDADVLNFVRSNPGAIGYVSTDATLDGVKVVEIRR